jgi:hypothetical protein
MKKLALALLFIPLFSFHSSESIKGIYNVQISLSKELNPYYLIGEGIAFSYVVENVGNSIADDKAYRIDLYINNKKIMLDKVGGKLGPYEKVRYTMKDGKYHFTFNKPGSYSYKIIVTPNKGYIDTDLSDNIISGEINVLKKKPVSK